MILLKFLKQVPMDADPAKVDVDEKKLKEIRQDIYDAAELLLRSRITISAQDWLHMTKIEKQAMKEVGNMLDAERIVQTVNAFLQPKYRAELLAPQDGGQALKDLGKADALAALNSRMDELGKEYGRRIYLHS